MFKTISTFVVAAVIATPLSAAYRISAWIAPWDQASLTSLEMNAGAMSESNPVWYSLDSSGRIVTNWNAENPTWRSAMTGTQLIPTIQNTINGSFNSSVMTTILATSSSRETHAESIRNLVVSKAFDGIDIDYESIPTSLRAEFTAFIELLASKLHASGKKLSVTVHPKTSDSQNWDGPGAQDWPRIGAVADSMKIMAYDYHWSTSAAGPLAPLDWIENVAAYAVSVVPAAKVIMAMPFYGYDWRGTNGVGVSYAKAMETAQQNGATIKRDANGEATFSYADHTVFFQDETSYRAKIDRLISRFPQLGGFANWCMGQEDAKVWTRIRELNATSGPNFADVPTTHPFYTFVETIYRNGLTAGCGAGNFCPSNSVTRGQMAVFLVRAKFGSAYQPPAATGKVFADVPATHPFAGWIEQLAQLGGAPSCGNKNYCPESPATRAEMALMLLRVKEGTSYVPPAAIGTFTDVPLSMSYAAWIEELSRRKITAGCGANIYCPSESVTRGQTSVFLTRTFGLQ